MEDTIDEVPDEEQLLRDYEGYPGKMSLDDYIHTRKQCGCTTCDCDMLSQDSYRGGCHTYALFDQVGDPTNSTESGPPFDENGSQERKRTGPNEEFEYLSLVITTRPDSLNSGTKTKANLRTRRNKERHPMR